MGFWDWLFGGGKKDKNIPKVTPGYNKYGERTGMTSEEFNKLKWGSNVDAYPKELMPEEESSCNVRMEQSDGMGQQYKAITNSEDYNSRLATIEKLGNTPSYESANALLHIAMEWSQQREESDDSHQAVVRIAASNMFNYMIEEQGKPGPPMSMEKARHIGHKAMSDAIDAVKSSPPPKVEPVPIQLIGEALARIGEPAIKATERWLSIKIHPVIAMVLLSTGEKLGGDRGIYLVKRVAGGYVDTEIKRLAEQTLTRITGILP